MKKFYRCDHCGIIVGIVEEGGGTLVCCGEPMRALEANTTDAAQEKHVPVVEVNGNTVTVCVGSVLHPMLEEHQDVYKRQHWGRISAVPGSDYPGKQSRNRVL